MGRKEGKIVGVALGERKRWGIELRKGDEWGSGVERVGVVCGGGRGEERGRRQE